MLFALSIGALPPCARTADPHFRITKLWEIQLAALVKEDPGQPSERPHHVHAVEFSDDEGLIALSMGKHSHNDEPWSHLLIINAHQPRQAPLQYDLPSDPTDRIVWSSDGKVVALYFVRYKGGPGLLRLFDGKMCTVGSYYKDFAGFLDRQIVVIGGCELVGTRFTSSYFF